jgi:hypothetical protein
MGREPAAVLGRVEISSIMRPMRALSFFFALMVGLVLAFLSPALAGSAPANSEPMIAPLGGPEILSSPDAIDELAVDLLPSLEFEAAPAIDPVA